MAKFNLNRFSIIAGLALFGAAPAIAQLSLPQINVPVGRDLLEPITGNVSNIERIVRQSAEHLARLRLRKLDRLVQRNRDTIDIDASGAPARRGELLVMEADEAALAQANAAGFTELGRDEIGELGFSVIRLSVPNKMTLKEAQAALSLLLPDATISADNLHFTQGSTSVQSQNRRRSSSISNTSVPTGVIDGAPGSAVQVTATRGFAKGAPFPSNHGSAVASLLKNAGVRTIFVADVYGTDPAGGNALAIARGLGWLYSRGSRVVTISLTGPRNAVVARAISAAQTKGMIVVAAVGNDGPAAPPAYPASYRNVISVTGVDRRHRALIEAGKALHLDYAAPGADVYGLDAKGKRNKLRGTSFATPLVAARIAIAQSNRIDWRTVLASEAIDLGKKGPDDTFGKGLICGECARR